MGLHQLSDELWRERRLLDLLLFKLEEQELVLRSGRHQWLGHTTRELEAVLDRVRGGELARAVASDVVAVLLGAPAGCALPALASRAPAPWGDLLAAHHGALLTQTAAVSAVARRNRTLIVSVQRAARRTVVSLKGAQPERSAVDDLEVALGPVSIAALLDQIALDLLAEGSPEGITACHARNGEAATAVELRARQADLAAALQVNGTAVLRSRQQFLGAELPQEGPAAGPVPGRPRTGPAGPGTGRTSPLAAQMWRSAGPS